MKNLFRTLALSTTLVLGLVIGASAQDAKSDHPRKGGFAELNLTDAQKAQMKANRESQKANHEKFKATLSAEQKAIMENKDLSPKEKIQKLNETLSAEQKAMAKANRESAKKDQEAFKATLSEEQKAKMEGMKGERGEIGRKRFEKKD